MRTLEKLLDSETSFFINLIWLVSVFEQALCDMMDVFEYKLCQHLMNYDEEN